VDLQPITGMAACPSLENGGVQGAPSLENVLQGGLLVSFLSICATHVESRASVWPWCRKSPGLCKRICTHM